MKGWNQCPQSAPFLDEHHLSSFSFTTWREVLLGFSGLGVCSKTQKKSHGIWYFMVTLNFQDYFMWVFPKIGVPQNGWFILETPIKMDDLGGPPLFLETPIYNFVEDPQPFQPFQLVFSPCVSVFQKPSPLVYQDPVLRPIKHRPQGSHHIIARHFPNAVLP